MQTRTTTFAIQRGADRSFADHGWLKTYHSFSFADYHDPANLQWGALRVFNEDFIAAGRGFPEHPHRDMEILTYVLEGELEHQDSMGNRGVVGPGCVQYMSAGTGIRHAEVNHSDEHGLHIVQMWLLPSKPNLAPAYGQREFSTDDRRGHWLLVASGRAELRAPIAVNQDAAFFVSKLEHEEIRHPFAADRLGFLFVADGDVVANAQRLKGGDAVRIAATPELTVSGAGEVLLWDLPPAA